MERKEILYKDLADEVIKVLFKDKEKEKKQLNESNMKRRIYDSINVLVALKVFNKPHKHIEYNSNSFLNKKRSSEEPEVKENPTIKQMKQKIEAKKLKITEVEALFVLFRSHHDKKQARKNKELDEDKVHFPFVALVPDNKEERNVEIKTMFAAKNDIAVTCWSKPFSLKGEDDILKALQ